MPEWRRYLGMRTKSHRDTTRGSLICMAGDWVVLMHITLPNGQKVEEQMDVTEFRAIICLPSSNPELEVSTPPFDLMRARSRDVSGLAPCADLPADSAADRKYSDGSARAIRAVAGAEEPGHHADLASLPRGTGAGHPLRREFFLPGLSFHAGAQYCADSSSALELAADTAQ